MLQNKYIGTADDHVCYNLSVVCTVRQLWTIATAVADPLPLAAVNFIIIIIYLPQYLCRLLLHSNVTYDLSAENGEEL